MSIGNAVKINNYQRPVNLTEIANRGKAPSISSGEIGDASFKDMFSNEMAADQGISFSKHASERLFSRGIEISQEMLTKISNAVDTAAAKGSRETLILTDDSALVVSVKNRTVITAFDRNNLRDGIVTSIDSAVIL